MREKERNKTTLRIEYDEYICIERQQQQKTIKKLLNGKNEITIDINH